MSSHDLPDLSKIKYPEHKNKTFIRIEDLFYLSSGKHKVETPYIKFNRERTCPKDWERFLKEHRRWMDTPI